MENKTIEFVRGFNSQLEEINRYCNLQLSSDGFVQAISFPEIVLFDDDNDNVEYVEELSLSRLVKTLGEVLEVANKELAYKADDFFAERKKQLKEKFPNAKISFNSDSKLTNSVFVSGEYDEVKLINALDVVKQDFEYIFEGCKLDVDI